MDEPRVLAVWLPLLSPFPFVASPAKLQAQGGLSG
jgi:hypothetical protein